MWEFYIMHPIRLMDKEPVPQPEAMLMFLVCTATKGHFGVHVSAAARAMLTLWHVQIIFKSNTS